MLLILRSKKKFSANVKEFNKKLSHHLKKAKVKLSFSSFEDIELFMETNNISLLVAGQPLTTWKESTREKSANTKGWPSF